MPIRNKKYANKTGIFIGRFQPFHLGHLHALKYALARCETLVIGIGSAQESGTKRNPFDANARARMIKESIKKAGLDVSRTKFIKIPDFYDDKKWFDYIVKKVPDIEVVFSRNPWVKRIFRKEGIRIVAPPWYNRRRISGTKIRKLMKTKSGWQKLVPKPVTKFAKSAKQK